MRRQTWIAAITAMAMLAGACSTSTTVGGPPGVAAQPTVSGDGPTATALDPQFAEANALAAQLIGRIGSDDEASGALLRAFEAGYDAAQTIAAVRGDALTESGEIPGVTPAAPPLGLVQLISVQRGDPLEASTLRHAGSIQLTLTVQTGRLTGPTPIDQLRASARDIAAISPVGELATDILLAALLAFGLTPVQIVELLVLGETERVRDDGCVISIPLDVFLDPQLAEDPCQGQEADPADERDGTGSEPETEIATDPGIAIYVGSVPTEFLEFESSEIRLEIAPDGTVAGRLSALERHDFITATDDLLCGIAGEQDCGDGFDECPATSTYDADFSSLMLEGDEPPSGTLTGTIDIEITTVPEGCGDGPETSTLSVPVGGTVTPERAELTDPFVLTLEREQPPS